MIELEKKVAEIVNPKPWKHDFRDSVGYLDGEHLQRCVKCGCRTDSHKTLTGLSVQLVKLRKTLCTLPDPYHIPTDRKGNEDAYDRCMGRAIEELQKITKDCYRSDIGYIFRFALAGHIYAGEDLELVLVNGYEYLSTKAKPTEVWDIIVKALEVK